MSTSVQPVKPHQILPKEGWQQYLQNALAAHRQNPQDIEAMQAIRQATEALNAYEQEGVNATKLSSIPGELGAVANGSLDAAKAIPQGMEQMVHSLRQGDIAGAATDIGKGLVSTAKGALAPWELALNELSGNDVSDKDRMSMLHDAGGSLTGLAALEAPGKIGQMMKDTKIGLSTNPEIGTLSEPPEASPSTPMGGTTTPSKGSGTLRPTAADIGDPYGLDDIPRPRGATPVTKQPKSPSSFSTLDDLIGKETSPVDELKDFKPKKPKVPFIGDKEEPYPTSAKDVFDELAESSKQNSSMLPLATHLIPGSIGRLVRMFSSMPDATSVRNAALKKALQASISSGLAPTDSTGIK